MKHFVKVADRSEKNSTRAHKLVLKWWDLLSCFPHVQLMSWHESLRSGHCTRFYFLRASKSVGWWTVIFQIKKSAVLMSPLLHPATCSFWSQCRNGPELCPLIAFWNVGGNELINEFYSFWEENVLSRKKNTNISVFLWLFLVKGEDAVVDIHFCFHP